MKKHLLLGIGILMAGVINAQVIFSGVSPASIQGNYAIEYGEVSGGWGSPDLLDPLNSVEDTLVEFLTDTLGCTSATNGVDIAGHIAVLYRGDCEFGTKTAMAEAAGAIACVIINNTPGGPVGMAPGTDGATVGIPVVMISDVDGATLINEMDNGPVEVFIGNKLNYFENDIGLTIDQILRPKYSSVPSAVATTGAEYPIDFSGKVYNYGSNNQTSVTLQAIITFGGTEVYNETATAVDILSGDSAVFTLPTFSPATWDEGYYSLKYITSSDSIDEYSFDNELESDFVISPSDLAYASIDETTLTTNSSGGTRPIDPGSGAAIPYFSSCIHFQDANASKLAPKSISFYGLKGSDATIPSMEGEEIVLQVIKINDIFTDVNDVGYNNPIEAYEVLMSEDYTYMSDLSGEFVTGNFDYSSIVALEDDERYMFCATTYLEDIFLGSDPERDYTQNREFYLQPMFPIEAGSGTFNPNGFGPTTVPSLKVEFIDAAQVSLKEEKMAINMNAYPSPASDILNVDFKQNEVSKVELVNMMGQTVVTQNVANNAENVTMNVASVENGAYIVKVYLTNNMTHTMQVVVNH